MPIIFFCLLSFLFIYTELSLLVWLGGQLGVFMLILLLGLSFAGGIFMLRVRGWYTLMNVRRQLRNGEMPAQALMNSGVWIAAGILLIIPGFLTDILAMLLLLPPVRLRIENFCKTKAVLWRAQIFVKTNRTFHAYRDENSTVFEAEYEKQADEDKRIK